MGEHAVAHQHLKFVQVCVDNNTRHGSKKSLKKWVNPGFKDERSMWMGSQQNVSGWTTNTKMVYLQYGLRAIWHYGVVVRSGDETRGEALMNSADSTM